MSKFLTEAIGAAEIAAGAFAEAAGAGPLGQFLISAGIGTVMSGIGTMLSPGPMQGLATTVRNPVAPWRVVYGRARVGGTVVYMHMWPGTGGGSDQMLDLVIVLAAHSCQSIDAVLFDMQRVQIDTTAAAPGAAAGSGSSFTPVQQKVVIASIARSNGVVTVQLNANIPYLIAGDHVQITDVPGDTTLNGTFQVAEILSQVFGNPGSITFTYLSGGINSNVTNAGHVHTQWADYGRTVYFELMLGNQGLGHTFAGMTEGTPLDGNMGAWVYPESPEPFSSDAQPNPWTANCSLQGKTAVFLRLHYSSKYYKGGLPQISFLMHGKNDILDVRTSPPSTGYTENAALCIADFLSNQTWGYKAQYGTEIPTANLIAAANVCDEPVELANSGSPPRTEPAYALNGTFEVTMKRGEVLRNMLTACGGRITYTAGQFIIWPAAWVGYQFAIGSNPGGGVVSLPAFSQIAAGPIRWRPTVAHRDLFNGVKGTYISQANKWQATDFPPYCQDSLHGYSGPSGYEGDANLAADGGDRLWLDIQLPFTISACAAQRLAKIELLRRRHFGTGTLVLNMTAYQMAVPDPIYVSIPFLGWNQKQLEVIDERLRVETGGAEGQGPRLVVELDVQETDASIYSWSTSEELTPQGYTQPFIPATFLPTELIPGFDTPYPWEPGYIGPLVGDAVFTGPVGGSPPVNEGRGTFGMQVIYGIDAQGHATASMEIQGVLPPNQLSSIDPPQITCAVGTAGNLPPGIYIVAASALDTGTPPKNSPLSVPVAVTIPASSPPANNGSIEVAMSWPAGSNGGEIYMAEDYTAPGSSASGYYFQQSLTSAQTTATITAFDQITPGAPDATFDHLAVAWKKVVHGGRFAAQVQAVTANTVTLALNGVIANQYAGSVLTLYGKQDSTQELIVLNMPIASNTASSSGLFTCTIGANAAGYTLPDLTKLLVVGDLLVMRMNPTFTATSFSDPLVANALYPQGATAVEAGHVAVVLSGEDAGDVQTIASVSVDGSGHYTIFELAAPWTITPAAGDIVIICEAAWGPEFHTHPFSVPSRGAVSGVVASPEIANLAGQTWLFIVRAQNTQDDNGLDLYAPMREIYVFGALGTRTIYTSQTMLSTDKTIKVDASAGDVVFTLLPFSTLPNEDLFIQKIDSTSNVVTWQTAGDAGQQYTISFEGFLAVINDVAPDVIVETPAPSVYQVLATIRAAPVGSAVELRINQNGVSWCTLTIPAGAYQSNIVSGGTLGALVAVDVLTLDITAVGSSNPGADLTVFIQFAAGVGVDTVNGQTSGFLLSQWDGITIHIHGQG